MDQSDIDTLMKAARDEDLGSAPPTHIREILERISKDTPVTHPTVRLYGVRDEATGGFRDPRFFLNDAVAYRAFEGEYPQSAYAQKPQDFEVWYLGTVDLGEGTLTDDENRLLIKFKELAALERT